RRGRPDGSALAERSDRRRADLADERGGGGRADFPAGSDGRELAHRRYGGLRRGRARRHPLVLPAAGAAGRPNLGGSLYIWYLSGTTIQGAAPTNPPREPNTSWQVVGPR